MVYQKVARPPLSIRDFFPTRGTTDDDLIKVTLEDGGVLFFVFKSTPNVISDPRWRLDRQLLPENLTAILREYDLEPGSHFVLSDHTVTVGKRVRLDIEPSTYWRTTMWYTTDSIVKSIRPARRPRKASVPVLGGNMKSEESSDYH